ncbi:MFS transporter [Gracilimonas mengyeensis]|uniref:Maltose/moltooligosaccharide transporter n=1 Tax=Gracilimonas mengyeensis TaxID=1302730 RepID=A0A521DWC8_9BACT|nr:MFS transporter [Gracilimonas mengyeensis]SMO75898.1 maltose/moltooligosaccharide transporter [Gracilimonas mengyeensis]
MEKLTKRPRLSFWEIWNMSFGFLGIQFGFALQNANVSRIFETLGANVDDIPILWIAAPLTGLVVQPIIGYFSDRTWTRLGRRRPYFLFGAIAASIALVIMPNSPVLWIAAGMLWIMDASINISMEPFRAFVGDMLPSEQRTKGFAMQSFFIGTGAVVASALPWIMTNWFGVANTAPEGIIPPSVRWSFYLGAVAFIGAVAWTVFKSKEYSPEQLKAFEEAEKEEIEDKNALREVPIEAGDGQKKITLGIVFALIGAFTTWMTYEYALDKEVYVATGGLTVVGLVMMIAGILQKSGKTEHGLVVVMHDFIHMPKTMKQLAIVQFFSWFALFAMWIYTTAGVTAHIYGTSDTTSALYNQGADWVGVMFGVYNGVAAIVAFGLAPMAKLLSRKWVHALSLILGGLGLISIYFFSNPYMLIISMIGVGIAWASILAMPYAILAGSIPSQKMGLYMGIFNFFIVLPQLIAATVLGYVTRTFFEGHAVYALMLGGAVLIIAAATMYFVDDVDETSD